MTGVLSVKLQITLKYPFSTGLGLDSPLAAKAKTCDRKYYLIHNER